MGKAIDARVDVRDVPHIDVTVDDDEMYCPVCLATSDSISTKRMRWVQSRKQLKYKCECALCSAVFERSRILGAGFVRVTLIAQPRGFSVRQLLPPASE